MHSTFSYTCVNNKSIFVRLPGLRHNNVLSFIMGSQSKLIDMNQTEESAPSSSPVRREQINNIGDKIYRWLTQTEVYKWLTQNNMIRWLSRTKRFEPTYFLLIILISLAIGWVIRIEASIYGRDQKLAMYADGSSFFTTFTVIIGLVVGAREVQNNRRQAAHKFLLENILKEVTEIREKLKGKIHTTTYAKAVRYSKLDPYGEDQILIRSLLNNLDYMCVAIENKIIEEELALKTTKYFLLSTWAWFYPYISNLRSEKGFKEAWKSIDKVIERNFPKQHEKVISGETLNFISENIPEPVIPSHPISSLYWHRIVWIIFIVILGGFGFCKGFWFANTQIASLNSKHNEAVVEQFYKSMTERVIDGSGKKNNKTTGRIVTTQALNDLKNINVANNYKNSILGFLYDNNLVGYLDDNDECSSRIIPLNRTNFKYLNAQNFEGQFPCVNLQGADLREANLKESNLERATLSYTNLRNANLKKASLERAKLHDVELDGANLENTTLIGAIFSEEEIVSACNWEKAIYKKDTVPIVDENQDYIKNLREKVDSHNGWQEADVSQCEIWKD